MPGFAPEPTELKRRRGNPGKRPLNQREPKPLIGLPACPDALSPVAKSVWGALGPMLVRNGVMSEADGPALAGLCATEALFLRVAPAVDEMALFQETTNVDGAGVEHVERKTDPGFKVVLELLKERRAQHAQFGMTPASRSKIVTLISGQDDSIESSLH